MVVARLRVGEEEVGEETVTASVVGGINHTVGQIN